jgi:glycosyltransferase involved in cell wall biosynthesis
METERKIYIGGCVMKKVMLICAPVSSRSGYGDHARDLVRSFIKHDKYDIKILDVPWGECPRNALDNKKDINIISRILKTNQVDKQPDVYVDIRIPNEFQTYGKVNIGITAGIETTAVSDAWIAGCNKMDLIIVPSEHSKKGFVDALYEKMQNMPDGKQQKIGELKLEKPMEVLFEGVDDNIYKPIENASLDLVDDIEEDFCFLHVGQWTQGGYGEDRKDIAKLVKIFYESFANKKEKPALLLKTNGATYSIMDREDCLRKINEIKSKFPLDWNLPNVYLLHGSLSEEEMNKLYNHPKVKSFISLTHGEGFGRPLLEASMVGLPVIASAWSGHIDFLSETDSMLLGGELKQVPQSMVWKDIIVPESQWFNVNEQQSYKAMNYCFQNYDEVKKKALNLMKINRDKFTLNKMTEKLNEIITPIADKVPSQVGLQLPKLKKVGDKSKEPPKVKLPKLKKLSSKVSV